MSFKKNITATDLANVLNNTNNYYNGAFTQYDESYKYKGDYLTQIYNIEEYKDFNDRVKNILTKEELLKRYILSAKHLNKLKRTDPNQKIIDAYDIDWSGFAVSMYGYTFSPNTTFEVLDLIFRMIKHLYSLLGADDLIWNDNGVSRSSEARMNWFDSNDFPEGVDKDPYIGKDDGKEENPLYTKKINENSAHSWHIEENNLTDNTITANAIANW